MGFWLAVQIGIVLFNVGWGAYTYYSAKKEKAGVNGIDPASVPRANEGDPVPKVYGTARLNAPSLVAFVEAESSPLELPDVGVSYGMDARLILCLSNDRIEAPGTHRASFLKMYVGDKELVGITFAANEAEGATRYAVNDPDILGGNVLGGGGEMAGNVIFYDGTWNQELSPLDGYDPAGLGTTSNYRGFVNVKFRSFFIGLSSTIPQYSFVIHNPVSIPGYESVSGPIGSGDANPAAVIYDLLTSAWGGAGNDPVLVDIESFADVAATLQDEQHGISLVVSANNSVRTIVEQVLKQIDGVLYEDPVTRRYVIKLVREDYDVNDLPVLDASNVINEPHKPTTLWDETVNEVRVIFTDPTVGYKPMPAIAQDLALLNASGNRRRSAEIQLPGVTSAALGYTLAQRYLNFMSRPLAKLELVVNRSAYNFYPSQPFVFTWPEWGYTGIFRVEQPNTGTLDNGEVRFVAVEDRFYISGRVFDPPDDEIGEIPPTPDPILVRTITEAPRWFLLKAFELGHGPDVDVQRGYYLARPEGLDSRYKVQASLNGGAEVQDAPARPFPAGFTVDLAYARESSPYDTTTGLRIRGLYGRTLGIASATDISITGINLLQVNGEIMAFEGFTDLGGGDWRLNNVWRGLLDTVPADHADGDQGYFLPGSYAAGALGSLGMVHGTEVVTHTQAAAASTWTPSADSPEDTFTARSRTLLPPPGQALRINASQTPPALEEGGVSLDWRDRDRFAGTITRQDASDETLEGGQTFDAVAYKGDSDQIVLITNHSSHTVKFGVGKAGHGELEIGVDARRAVSLPDGTTPTLSGWQVPTRTIQAHHWRNLLLNPRFAGGDLSNWETVSGTPSTSNTASLGSAGYHVTGNSAPGANTEIRQDIDVSGYLPHDLTAILDFFVANLGDAGDTITVHLMSLDAGGSTLQTSTYGPTDPGAGWGQTTLTIADLHNDTVTLRVRVILTWVGDVDGDADVSVTELCLRVGQISSQLLANPSFESGVGGGWSITGGAWQVLGATKYDAVNYARPQDGASAQLRQAVSLPTGFEDGAAVLECARMNDAASDTGTVTLEALDGGGSVLSSVTTGAEAISPSNAWQRRRLVLDPIPATATQLRVTLDAARVAGTPLNSCFDGFDLRCHKHLDPDDETILNFEERAEQPLPRTVFEWKAAFNGFGNPPPAPDYAIFDGGLVGRLGVEPLMEADTGVVVGAKVVQAEGKRDTTTGYENADRGDRDVHTSPVGTAFANFGLGDAFSAFAFYKVGEQWSSTACGLMGRIVGEGWALGLNDDAKLVARFAGAAGNLDVQGTAETGDGSLHGGGLIHNPASGSTEVTVVDAAGAVTGDIADAGEFRSLTPGRFRLLRATDVTAEDLTGTPLPGQLVRAYIWRRALTVAQMQTIIRYAEQLEAWGTITGTARTGSIACVVGSDASGVLVETFGPGRVAQHIDQASGRLALTTMPAITNLVPASGADPAVNWGPEDATATVRAATDPRGLVEAIQIVGQDDGGWLLNDTLGGAGTIHVAWLARADDSHTASIRLQDNGSNSVALTTFNVTTEWQLYTWAAAWNGATGGIGGVRWQASNGATTRTIYLCPVACVSTVKPPPGTFPIGSPGATAPTIDTSALTAQFNREGEIEVEVAHVDADGTIANIHNGTNDNDRRTVRWNQEASSDLESEHHNASGTTDTTAELVDTTIDEFNPYKVRLRWNRAGTIDGLATAWVVLRAEQGATVVQDAGRAATFTASTTVVDNLDLGHESGAGVLAGGIFGVRLSTRERKV